MDYQVRTIWNVIATIKGEVEPDRWVMIGNHRDAWVYGAVDPGSGTAATLETCRALGAAVKNGWKPRRTLVYASWDAEEYGLVGSTEWADEHAEEIDEKAVMLLNVDSAVSGPELDVDGVPSLRDLCSRPPARSPTSARAGRSARSGSPSSAAAWAGAAPDRPRRPLWDGRRTGRRPGRRRRRAGREFSPQLNPLGSGSDYTAFLDHLGVPALDVGFSGRYGVYHSIYDDFFWMEKFGDPEFVTHATAARLYTLIAMRAAGGRGRPAPVRPLRRGAPRVRRRPPPDRRPQGPGGRARRRPGRRSPSRGCPALVAVDQGVRGPGRGRSTRRPTPWRSRDGVAAGAARAGQRRPDAGRAGVPARPRPPRPPLVQARDLRPRA